MQSLCIPNLTILTVLFFSMSNNINSRFFFSRVAFRMHLFATESSIMSSKLLFLAPKVAMNVNPTRAHALSHVYVYSCIHFQNSVKLYDFQTNNCTNFKEITIPNFPLPPCITFKITSCYLLHTHIQHFVHTFLPELNCIFLFLF